MEGLNLVLLGAGSGLLWGTADFFGGLQSRRLPALTVLVWSQIVGGTVLLAAALLTGEHPDGRSVLWGIAAGLVGGFALLCFYRGLAVGTMSIVAPISGCGALVPVIVSFATGHAPGAAAVAGMFLALAGVVVVSLHADSDAHPSGRPGLALALAVLSAIGFGTFYVVLQHGGSGTSSALWPIVGVRIGSLALLLSIVLAGRRPVPWPGRQMSVIACVGLADTSANILWLLAATHGNLGVAAVLGSLYPVATVVLGRAVLAERLSRIQQAGVVLALAGVALVGQ
jgi:drug/metabolite transporter (DMT)-like permease